MNDEITEYESDELWLVQNFAGDLNDEIIDYFCDRVAIMVVDANIEENEAREIAMKEVEARYE